MVDTILPGVNGASPLWSSGRLGDWLYFAAYTDASGAELWRTSGTTTELVEEIQPGPNGSDPGSFAALGDWLYFAADDGTNGRELWRTNGVETALVRNIAIELVGVNASDPAELTALGGWLYFRASDGAGGHGLELWRTNGTDTQMVRDIQLGTGDSFPTGFTALGGYLYFAANDGAHGNELWRTNGITTEMVKNIADEPAEPDSSDPSYFTALGNYLYFSADDVSGGHGRELWRTDGTAANTQMVKDINTGGDSYPLGMTAFHGAIYFQAYTVTNGTELWRTNGTLAGTVQVNDINQLLQPVGRPGASSSPNSFTAFGGYLYFSADDGTHGAELWRTDGVAAHTTMVQNINVANGGADGSAPYAFTAMGDYLYFVANDATSVGQFWRVNNEGVTETTALPGTNGFVGCMCAEPLIPLGSRLFMTTYTDETGMEFAYLDEPNWVMPSTDRDGSSWSTAFVLLAALTAVVGAGLRVRACEARRA
ncbi:MAG: ELWxxDGT repeat protein [bacterium]